MSDKLGRKTTPEQYWILPCDGENISEILLTFSQNGVIVVEKRLEDVVIQGNQLSYKLKQEETIKFQSRFNLDIQLEIKTVDGDVLQSDVVTVTVARCLNERML